MKNQRKKLNVIQYSKSMDKNLRMINKNKNLNELLQEMNNINENILRYKQIENMMKYTSSKEFEKKSNENNFDKGALLDDIKLLQNKLYKSNQPEKNENNNCNIKTNKNTVKDVIKDIFGKRDIIATRKFFPKSKGILNHIKLLNDENMNFSERLNNRENIKNREKNISVTERNINNDKSNKNINKNNTIESEKNLNVNFLNYGVNCVKFKHPQFYLLNNTNKKHLPPIKLNKVKMVDLYHKNNNYLKGINKRNKYEKYIMAMHMATIAKFKINQ